jgi:hypothetical protein
MSFYTSSSVIGIGLLLGCTGSPSEPPSAEVSARSPAADSGRLDAPHAPIEHVFVVALENHDLGTIVGNAGSASFINDELLAKYASAANFIDRLPIDIPSEPHYVWMEAGTHTFDDHTFTSDDPPSATNSTSSPDHLATQLAQHGLTYTAYQEGIDGKTGACPIEGSNYYQPKHDPFVFFQDISGNPPSKSNAKCAAHHKPLTQLEDDLRSGDIANYNFITPDLCHDMHGDEACSEADTIQASDDWLRAHLPALIDFCDANAGVVFVVWDEGESSSRIPFLALGARTKPHYVGDVEYDHGSLVRSVETIFALPVLATVRDTADFSDLFQPGQFP